MKLVVLALLVCCIAAVLLEQPLQIATAFHAVERGTIMVTPSFDLYSIFKPVGNVLLAFATNIIASMAVPPDCFLLSPISDSSHFLLVV